MKQLNIEDIKKIKNFTLFNFDLNKINIEDYELYFHNGHDHLEEIYYKYNNKNHFYELYFLYEAMRKEEKRRKINNIEGF